MTDPTPADELPEYVLLVDESGVDGTSKKLLFAGCLLEKSNLSKVEDMIVAFNQAMLDHPRTTGNASWVETPHEARHYTEDHFTLRELFVREVVEKIPCRTYAVMADYDGSTELVPQKQKVLKKLLAIAASTRRAGAVTVIAEASSGGFDKLFPDVDFRDKSYLPLSIADYYAASLSAFHEYRLKKERGEAVKENESSIVVQFYKNVGTHIALEMDISTGEKSFRGRRYFLEKLMRAEVQ